MEMERCGVGMLEAQGEGKERGEKEKEGWKERKV